MADKDNETLIGSWQKHKKLYLWALGGFILVAIVVYLAISLYISAPQNLDPDLRYAGEQGYGCLFICDSAPSANYYFATHMNSDQLISYFDSHKYTFDSQDYNTTLYNGHTKLGFNRSDGNGFELDYYDSALVVHDTDQTELYNTDNLHIIKITDASYPLIRRYLQ